MSNKTKSRLGRGLSSLISLSEDRESAEVIPAVDKGVNSRQISPVLLETSLPVPTPTSLVPSSTNVSKSSSSLLAQEVRIDQIVANPHQPRRTLNEASIAELASSLKSTGLIQPIIVRRSGNQFELIAGERRWRAAKAAGLTTLLAIVREVTGYEQAQMALVENIQREDLNPIDRAQAYKTLMGQLGLTQAEIASRTGEDRSSVANYLRLLDLAAPVQAMVSDGRLTLGHAKILAGISDASEQERLAHLVANQNLSVRNLERHIQEGAQAKPRTEVLVTPHVIDLEKSLSQQLGLRVQVRSSRSKGKGKMILHYASLDQFDDLVLRLGINAPS